MTIENITEWHRRARPTPDDKAFNVQLGCHLEEVAEMIADLKFKTSVFADTRGKDTEMYKGLMMFADLLKLGRLSAEPLDRENFLKELCDQVVTAAGVAHCAGINMPSALKEVDLSNWSKFVDGQPVFDKNGKISKPDSYRKPDLQSYL